MPGGIGDWAAMPRPLAKMETYSSKSTAIAIAWRSLRERSYLPRQVCASSPCMDGADWRQLPQSAGFASNVSQPPPPPKTGSSQLKPVYIVEVATEVERVMPCAFI